VQTDALRAVQLCIRQHAGRRHASQHRTRDRPGWPLRQQLEDLVYNAAKAGKVVYRTKNDDLLVSYWSLVFDYSKGIVCLLANKFHSPAFALMRPLVEAVTREHIVLVGSEDEVKKIRNDRFKVNYHKDGARIDKVLGSGSLFEGFLKGSREMLHSLTHSGTAQLQNRWDGACWALGSPTIESWLC
jgi:hypothetical protein